MAERYDAFVSYAHGEREFAERLVAVLRGRGISPFIDTAEVRPGEDWAARLEEGLRSAATVLVLLGGEPFGSARTREVDAALELGDRVPVIPVLIPGIGDPAASVPAELRARQWVDLRAGLDDPEAVEALIRSLELARDGPVEPTRSAAGPSEAPASAEPAVDDLLSDTVRAAARALSGPVTASALAGEIARRHPEYSGGRAARLSLDPDPGPRRGAQDWLAAVARIVDPRAGRVIHGRLAIAGLARLDPDLRAALSSDGFLGALEAEIREPIGEVFLPVDPDGAGAIYAPSALAGDRAAPRDDLGVGVYASAFARLVLLPQTDPLTVGIHGDWGRGKSTFMRLVERDLITGALGDRDPQVVELVRRDASGDRATADPAARAVLWSALCRRAAPSVVTVWFNAWRYQGPTEVWAGLASEVSRALEDSLSSRRVSWRRLRLRLHYAWTHRKTELVMSVVLPIVALAAVVGLLAYAGADAVAERAGDGSASGPFGDALRLLVPAGSVALVVWFAYTRLRDVAQRISDRVLGYLRLPDYRDQTGLQHRVIEDLRFAYEDVSDQIGRRVPGAPRGPKVVVFVDDLDRCSDEKIIETLEAIFLVLAESGFFVFVGMDTGMIYRAIRSHYEAEPGDVTLPERLPDRYLRKIIQLSFYLPAVEPAKRLDLLRSLFSAAARAPSAEAGDAPSAADGGAEPAAPREARGGGAEAGAAAPDEAPAAPTSEAAPVEDTPAELAAFADLKDFLDPNPREIKRLLNLHRYVKLVLQRPGEPWTEDDQRKLVKWVMHCASEVPSARRGAFDQTEPRIREADLDLATTLGRRLADVSNITRWVGAPAPAARGAAPHPDGAGRD